MKIYDRIRLLASEKNISIRELEIKLGFSNGLLRSWNKSTNTASLEKVANYFDVSVDYLLGRTNTRSKKDNSKVKDMVFNNHTENDKKELKMELIDELHFLFNKMHAVGMTTDELFNYYFSKNEENRNRQRNGY